MQTGTQILQQTPPLYDFSQLLGQYLIGLLNSGQLGAPGNPYNLNVPLSPTTQMWGRMAQNFAMSPAPQVLGQAQGSIGRFFNPDYSGIVDQLKGGFAPFQQPTPHGGGRMYGGPVDGGSGGQTYTVGEHGPETLLLEAGSRGSVLPNPSTPTRTPMASNPLADRMRALYGGQ